MCKDAVLLHQCGRRSGFRNIAAGQHDDLIGTGDGAHPVCDDQNRFIGDQAGECGLNQRLILDVERGGCFIQQDDRCILEECARDRDALPFAARKLAAVFADQAVPLLRQLFCKFIDVCELCRRNNFFIGRVRLADADILHDRIIEQRDILKNDGIERHQRFGIDLRDIHAADRDSALCDIPEARRQTGDGRFAAAGGTDQRRDRTLLCRERDILEDGLAVFVSAVVKQYFLERW